MTKTDFITMMKSGIYNNTILYEYYKDRYGELQLNGPLLDANSFIVCFKDYLSKKFSGLSDISYVILNVIVPYYKKKFSITTLISKNGELLNMY